MTVKFIDVNKKGRLEKLLKKGKFKDRDVIFLFDKIYSFVTRRLKRKIIEEAKKSGAVVSFNPTKDTIKEVDENNFIKSTLNRKIFLDILYPQAIRWDLLKPYVGNGNNLYKIHFLKGLNYEMIELDKNI